jgi:cytoskeletal protein RodZ
MLTNKYFKVSNLLKEDSPPEQFKLFPSQLKNQKEHQGHLRDFLMKARYKLRKKEMPSVADLPGAFKILANLNPKLFTIWFIKDKHNIEKLKKSYTKYTKNEYFQSALSIITINMAKINGVSIEQQRLNIIEEIKKKFNMTQVIEVSVAIVIVAMLWYFVTSGVVGWISTVAILAILAWGIKTAEPQSNKDDSGAVSKSTSRKPKTKGDKEEERDDDDDGGLL